jgi:hypothetical protein
MIEERVERKLSSLKWKYLSVGGRLVLTNSVLSSLPMFMASFFRFQKECWKKLTIFSLDFFWQNDSQKKYRLTK